MRKLWLRFIDWIDGLFFNEMGPDDEYDPGPPYIEEEWR